MQQFLDLGSGIPTVDNVHEIAQKVAPETRVVCVDVDLVAVAHARLILTSNPHAAVIGADVRDPSAVLGHPHSWPPRGQDVPTHPSSKE